MRREGMAKRVRGRARGQPEAAPEPLHRGRAVLVLREGLVANVRASFGLDQARDVAHDQRGTDAFSLVYDSEPLAEDVEIMGFPLATLTVAADATRTTHTLGADGTMPVVRSGASTTSRECQ